MIQFSVLADEPVYAYEPANNGGSPLWCIGTTCVVRTNAGVFVSGIETIRDAIPLNNVRWTLYQRIDSGGWRLPSRDEKHRTREPSPIACFHDGRLFLSVNPTLTGPDAPDGPADPHVLQFDGADPARPPQVLRPSWAGSPAFTEHSYRGMAADGVNGELLVSNNEGYDAQHWSFCDRAGHWSACGKYEYPLTTEYGGVPTRIRLCYHNIGLRGRAAHFFATGDIAEPHPEWRDFKGIVRDSGGKRNDWVFRRAYYYWTPDITRVPLSAAAQIASVEESAGFLRNLDLWLDPSGRVHLLWLQKNIASEDLRDRFFPGTPICTSLQYAIISGGEVVYRRTLVRDEERPGTNVPGWARFHPVPDGRLYVFYTTYDRSSLRRGAGIDVHNHSFAEGLQAGVVRQNRLLLIAPAEAGLHDSVVLPVEVPLARFMTACERAGAPPSAYLDVLGMPDPSLGEVRHVRIRV